MEHIISIPYSIEYLITDLKKARKKKSLSQRELSKKTKIPQSHISKIESGLVDLHVSSLIEMARILDLEVMLVPRQLISIVQALQQPQTEEQVPMYRITKEDEDLSCGSLEKMDKDKSQIVFYANRPFKR